MLDLLGLPHLEAQATQVDDTTLVIHAAVTAPPVAGCPHCRAARPYRYGEQAQIFADAPIRGQPVRIQVNRSCYRCRTCRKTFFIPLQGFSTRRLMTRRLVHHLEKASMAKPFAEVSQEVGVDEAHRTGKYCTVLTDLERREYFDMFPTREGKPLAKLFASIPNKHRIEVVAMDLWRGYETLVREYLPQAVIVADKYHVVRMANKAVETAHRDIRKDLPTGERLALFRQRNLFSRPPGPSAIGQPSGEASGTLRSFSAARPGTSGQGGDLCRL